MGSSVIGSWRAGSLGAWLLAFVAILTPSVSSRASAAAEPEAKKSPFFSGTYEQAKAEAVKSDRTLVLYFTATWCGPCKQMERTTWADAGVIEKMNTEGLVLKIDIDKHGVLAKRFGVRAVPTMIAMKGDDVGSRITGGRQAGPFLAWFEKARQETKTPANDVSKPVEWPIEVDAADSQETMERHRRLTMLLVEKKYDEALVEATWLWDHGVDENPAYAGVRGSFLLGMIGQICQEHPQSRAAFSQRRDAAESKLNAGEPDAALLLDMVMLNNALKEDQKTLIWFDAHQNSPWNWRADLIVVNEIFGVLTGAERWADAGRLLIRPVESAKSGLVLFTRPSSDEERTSRKLKDFTLKRAAERYATEHVALLAAGREIEAMRLAAMVVDHLGVNGRMALAQMALKAKVVQPIHLRLLTLPEGQEPVDGISELRGQVQAALGEQATQ